MSELLKLTICNKFLQFLFLMSYSDPSLILEF